MPQEARVALALGQIRILLDLRFLVTIFAMRIAFYGGSFDPPHRGHIAIAREAISRLGLDRVLFAPVAAQPLKGDGRLSSFEDRLAMVRLAVQDDPGLVPSSADAPRPDGRPNYTLDTLIELRRTLATGDDLFCLVGSDAFFSLRQWHRAAELVLFCDFIVASRPGFPLETIASALPEEVHAGNWRKEPESVSTELLGPRGQRSKLYLLPGLTEDVSASEIRAALAEGGSSQTVLAPRVAEYIRAHGLYRHPQIDP